MALFAMAAYTVMKCNVIHAHSVVPTLTHCAGVAYTAVKEPETVGGTATVSTVEIKKAGESVQTNGGAPAAGSIVTWSEYSNTELFIDPNDPSIFAIYSAVPYAGPARSGTGGGALPNGGTWIGYIPVADMKLL